MHISDELDFQTIRRKIKISNRNAKENNNLYPIQEQATLKEIWEFVPCECESSCTCKKFGCSGHWRLKEDLDFYDVENAFLRMFVNKTHHGMLKNYMKKGISSPVTLNQRVEKVPSILENLRCNWDRIYAQSLDLNRTLICNNWYNDFWKNKWDFKARDESIYKAKQFCILLPDIGVPYDTDSRNKILSFLSMNNPTYFELLSGLRNYVNKVLKYEKESLSNFRKLDKPREQLPFDSRKISLKKQDLDYGKDYDPKKRPISRILDKCFYRPSSKKVRKNKNPKSSSGINRKTLYPLSGRGSQIVYEDTQKGKEVKWGDKTYFTLNDDLISDLLNNYFQKIGKWYPLGAGETNPTKGGLGEYLQEKYDDLTPRHASAIAAIMEHEGLLEAKGKRPIKLKKIKKRK